MLFKNPIIPGYNPDPSICCVGSDYYIVNSTFEFFPGVPIYHSKNLVNWELTGYCLDRRSQLELEDCRNSGGIYAPTIRYHKGMFYMITTNVTDKGNFVVHTEDINSEWSEPAWIDQGGIDPSLFFDDDDKCYYCSTGIIDGVRGIAAFEINPLTGEILSEKKLISEGCGGQCPEGPHIYKKDGWYYLMIAEGGTEYAHRETIQRSRNVYGPYEACPDNPIISHKEYKKSEIQATGHADLLEDENGNWWLVFLGIRRFSHALLHNLGRETFLAPVKWENGWPVVGYNGNGTIELVMDAPLPGLDCKESVENIRIDKESGQPILYADHSVDIDFTDELFDKRFQYTRNPDMSKYIYDNKNAVLTLKGTDITLNTAGKSPTIVSFKQPEFTTTLYACLDIAKCNAKRCGVAAYYNNDYHYEIYIGNDDNGRYIGFYKHIHDMGVELERIPINNEDKNFNDEDKNYNNEDRNSNNQDMNLKLLIKIDTDREKYTFSYAIADTANLGARVAYRQIGSGLNAGLSTEGTRTMTFTGILFSLFAENGDGVFNTGVKLLINPDENYTL